jgi:hypothetical protein
MFIYMQNQQRRVPFYLFIYKTWYAKLFDKTCYAKFAFLN